MNGELPTSLIVAGVVGLVVVILLIALAVCLFRPK
jgi:hypothetical protein